MPRKHASTFLVVMLTLLLGLLVAPFAGAGVAQGAAARSLQLSASGVPTIVDDAHILNGTAVQNEVQRLQSLGVDVYVRTFPSLDASYATLDDYVAALQTSTPAWQNPDGTRKSNLLILAVSVKERSTYIGYGAAWASSLGANNQYLTVQTDYMNPHFRDGDFTGGFVAGMDRCYALINAQLHPSSAQPPNVGAAMKVLGYVALGVLGLLAIALAAIGMLVLRRSRIKKQNMTADALQKKTEAATLVMTLEGETLQGLQLHLETLKGKIPVDEMTALQAGYRTVDQAITSVVVRYGSLTPFAPGARGVSSAALERMIGAYDAIIKEMQAVQGQAADFENRLLEFMGALAQAGPAIEQAQHEVEQAKSAVTTAAGQGYKTAAVEAGVAQAEATMHEASVALDQQRYVQALALATDARTTAQRASHEATELPLKKEQFAQAAAALQARLDQIRSQALPQAHASLAQMRSHYAAPDWQAVKDNETQATAALQDSSRALSDGQAHAADDRQEWTEAFTSLDAAGQTLDSAGKLAAEITRIEAHLAAAESDLPAKMEHARGQIASVQSYLSAHSLDGTYQTRLHEAQVKLDEGSGIAQQQRPDVLAALALAESSEQEADQVLADAQAEVKRREDEQRRPRNGPTVFWPIFIGPIAGRQNEGSLGSRWGGGGGGGWGGGGSGWGGGGGGGGSTGWGGGGGSSGGGGTHW